MTDGDMTIVAAIEIPSTNPVFLTIVGVHVLLALACAVTGAIAILSEKRSTAGEIIARCLSTGTEFQVRQFPPCMIPPGGAEDSDVVPHQHPELPSDHPHLQGEPSRHAH